MDVLAHGFWTNVVFYKTSQNNKKQRYLTVLFGILPDVVSFTPATLYVLLAGKNFSPELFFSQVWMFKYAAVSYNFTHSLVIFVLVATLITAMRRWRVWWPIWGWGLHVLIDIPTHKNFYETPFLYPLSDYRFHYGIPWAEPTFMLINYGLLLTIYLYWFLVLRKRYVPKAD